MERRTRRHDMKRLEVTLPETEFAPLLSLADQRQVTVVELVRRYIRLGLLLEADASPDTIFLLRRGEVEREIILL